MAAYLYPDSVHSSSPYSRPVAYLYPFLSLLAGRFGVARRLRFGPRRGFRDIMTLCGTSHHAGRPESLWCCGAVLICSGAPLPSALSPRSPPRDSSCSQERCEDVSCCPRVSLRLWQEGILSRLGRCNTSPAIKINDPRTARGWRRGRANEVTWTRRQEFTRGGGGSDQTGKPDILLNPRR